MALEVGLCPLCEETGDLFMEKTQAGGQIRLPVACITVYVPHARSS